MKRLLVLTDGKAGHENQSRAFARALGCDFDVLPVSFRGRWAKTLSYALGRLGVFTPALLAPTGDVSGKGYAAVVGAGSGTFYAAKALARGLGVRCAAILYPRGYSVRSFDCVMAPSFDRPAKLPNVICIPANLVSADEDFYRSRTDEFLARHTPARDAVAVIVGGPNKCSTMTAEWMRAELDRVFAENRGREFWVTTSRRTPPEVEAVVESFPFDYKLVYSRDSFNPIPAFVTLAKRIYVTAESTGMLSEACTFGTAEVKSLDNLMPGPHKFRRFVEGLRADGYLGGNRKIDLSAQLAEASRLLGL